VSTFKLNCGCVVSLASGTERIIEQCVCCAAEFNERHERAVEDRRRIAAVPPVLLTLRTVAASRIPDDVQ
jgi:hypothetical protein